MEDYKAQRALQKTEERLEQTLKAMHGVLMQRQLWLSEFHMLVCFQALDVDLLSRLEKNLVEFFLLVSEFSMLLQHRDLEGENLLDPLESLIWEHALTFARLSASVGVKHTAQLVEQHCQDNWYLHWATEPKATAAAADTDPAPVQRADGPFWLAHLREKVWQNGVWIGGLGGGVRARKLDDPTFGRINVSLNAMLKMFCLLVDGARRWGSRTDFQLLLWQARIKVTRGGCRPQSGAHLC